MCTAIAAFWRGVEGRARLVMGELRPGWRGLWVYSGLKECQFRPVGVLFRPQGVSIPASEGDIPAWSSDIGQ